jgi:phosphoribosylaminoimidazolecarboxamide formyltransferase/IMP cyclohydrolase
MSELLQIKRALLSVSDKEGLIEFARQLNDFGMELVSTGGTARALREAGLSVTDVADVTGFPEMMDGRVKTLHPKIHGALLAVRDNAAHAAAMQAHGIAPIDLVVVNLYPFEQTIEREGATLAEAIENIDIGGPAMIRSAAKNWRGVAVVTSPDLYNYVAAELIRHDGALSAKTRAHLARLAFTHTAKYDAAIFTYLDDAFGELYPLDYFPDEPLIDETILLHTELDFTLGYLGDDDDEDEEFPDFDDDAEETRSLAQSNGHPFVADEDEDDDDETALGGFQVLELEQIAGLRYGENPHQQAALYDDCEGDQDGVAQATLLHGKAMSYNNYVDADAAWQLVCDFDELACAIIKHTNPAGVAWGANAEEAYRRALATDPVSAFGGIVAFNRPLDAAAARAVAEIFTEVVIAPAYEPAALDVLQKKKNLRVLLNPYIFPNQATQYRQISGGFLAQDADTHQLSAADLKIVTQRAPTPDEIRALLFAWTVCKHTKSNAIVFAREGQTLGVGAGQMNRLDSTRIAAQRAARHELPLAGAVLASDAFFPFRDGLDEAAQHGIAAVIQPGGSVRDAEVIQAADEHGLAMVFTGIRHFRH